MNNKVFFPEGHPAIWCQACGVFHELNTDPAANPQNQYWLWNNNLEQPTFFPMWKGRVLKHDGSLVTCHFEVHDGKIIYQPDSTHAYAGQTFELRGPS